VARLRWAQLYRALRSAKPGPAQRGHAHPRRIRKIRIRFRKNPYPRTSFRYRIRCGWLASAPSRRFRSTSYSW
jgi:hypothetical protein